MLVLIVLEQMFKDAVQWGHLDASPAPYAERPRGENKEMEILTVPEIRQRLQAAESGR